MTTITITIQRSSVLADMKVKNHHEAALIPDTRERYLVEAGTEKVQELHQCITDAFADASAIVRPFIKSSTESETATGNDTYASTGDLSVVLYLTWRKADGLAVPLTAALHEYIVDDALAKFYKAVAHPTLSQAREADMKNDQSTIESLLHRRGNPTYSTI